MSDHNNDDDFNPIGTAWIMVIFFFLIIGFWGYAYLEMMMRR